MKMEVVRPNDVYPIAVTYEKRLVISEDVVVEIKNLYTDRVPWENASGKVRAIKALRNRYPDFGLKEAKDLVEFMVAQFGWGTSWGAP